MAKVFLLIILFEFFHSSGCMKNESRYCKEEGYIGQGKVQKEEVWQENEEDLSKK